ncbi:MAG: CDP-alcohol phosphatidyltransferase family protein [Chloroflexi bacterium]|nr:CDP-alcohol phosphatidyltransferase family protein [Chloroflexota bacterium]
MSTAEAPQTDVSQPSPSVQSAGLDFDESATGQTFLPGLLKDLRAERFRPRAWRVFLGRSWERSLEDARHYPWLVTGTLVSTVWLAAVALTWVVAVAQVMPLRNAVTVAVVTLLGLCGQQVFVLLHVGMMQPLNGGERLRHLGIANSLTLLRLMASWLLLGFGVGDVTSHRLLLGVLLMGAFADTIDGSVARLFEHPTRLGRLLDAIADALLFCIGAAVFSSQGILPVWFAVMVFFRFFLPFLFAVASYFLASRPVRYIPTRWGKIAGAALTIAFVTATARSRNDVEWQQGSQVLLIAVSFLLVVAIVVQLWNEYQRWNGPLSA